MTGGLPNLWVIASTIGVMSSPFIPSVRIISWFPKIVIFVPFGSFVVKVWLMFIPVIS